jgi:hypothetical protein
MHLGIRWKKQISGYVQDDYKAGVIRAGNRDKVKVPVSVLRKRETEQTEEAKPLLLFIDTEDHPDKETYFSPELISLLNRRFCIARVHLPASLYRSPESTEMVTAAISALADQKLCKTGMVTLAGKGRGAIIALNTFNAHPAWISCLVLNNPGYEVNLATMPVPDTYLVAGNGGLDENLANLKLASEIRRHIKPENTLLVKSNSLQDPDFKSGLITFILAANGINK